MGQLGVPLAIAENLTVPVMVSSFNIAELTMLLEKGRILHVIKKNGGAKINMKYALNRRSTPLKFGDIVHRGANSRLVYVNRNIELKEGDMIERDGAFLTDVVYPQKKHYNLQIGDVAERMLMDGDIVLLNRQPTLHSGSMMAQEVKVKTTNTFSFNLAITKSFNADFDGDEMNIHVPQTLEAQSELRMISASQNMIISPQTSKTNVTIVQDALLGAYQMTFGIQPLRRDQFFDISMRTQLTSDQVLKRMQRIRRVMHDHGKKAQCFHGKGVVSLILPPDFDYEKENKGDPAEPVLRIKGGVVVEGAFNKAILGSVSNGIIQVLNKEYGPEVATRFVDNIQFVANAYLLIRGFSIGIEDCLVQGKEQGDRIKDVIERCYIEAEGIRETTYHPGIREVRITAALSKAKDIGLRIAKDSLDKNNNFLRTVNSGSKGDYFNIAQITGLLGQQNLLGQRVAPELNNGSRSLPHYPMPHKKSSIDGKTVSQSRFEREMEYESRGFVASSFIKGLNPREFFFHAMSGREGICDTAMNTAKSGYIQRRIVKLTEDMKVCYDGTVRDTFGKVYQLAYGEDSMNPVHTLNVGGMQHCCDVGRLVNRLNATVEKSIAKVEKQVLVALPNTK
jgi:DNA-directed RNA polymerase beta' subunit